MILKSVRLDEIQISNDILVLVIFWADACAIQHTLIVVNGQTATSAFRKVA